MSRPNDLYDFDDGFLKISIPRDYKCTNQGPPDYSFRPDNDNRSGELLSVVVISENDPTYGADIYYQQQMGLLSHPNAALAEHFDLNILRCGESEWFGTSNELLCEMVNKRTNQAEYIWHILARESQHVIKIEILGTGGIQRYETLVIGRNSQHYDCEKFGQKTTGSSDGH